MSTIRRQCWFNCSFIRFWQLYDNRKLQSSLSYPRSNCPRIETLCDNRDAWPSAWYNTYTIYTNVWSNGGKEEGRDRIAECDKSPIVFINSRVNSPHNTCLMSHWLGAVLLVAELPWNSNCDSGVSEVPVRKWECMHEPVSQTICNRA
jgi:hypothetical protein